MSTFNRFGLRELSAEPTMGPNRKYVDYTRTAHVLSISSINYKIFCCKVNRFPGHRRGLP